MAKLNRKLLRDIPWLKTKVKQYKVFDVETTDLLARVGKIFAFCIGHWNGKVDVYRLDHKSKRKNLNNWYILKDFIEDTSIAKIAHNYKMELSFMKRSEMLIDIKLPDETFWHDTMLMHGLLRNLVPKALDYLSWDLFGFTRELDRKVKKLGKLLGGYQYINKTLFTEYQIADGFRPMVLFRCALHRFLEDEKLMEDYINELDLIRVTEEMEHYGMKIDFDECDNLIEWCTNEFEKVVFESTEFIGETINLSSPPKLANLLYGRYNYPILKQTKNGNPSLDKDVLFDLKEMFPHDKIFDFIFRWRSYKSGITSIAKYKELADEDFILHPNIKTNHAKTGREASENPNLFNVAKKEALKNPYPVNARSCFVCRDERILYFVDYKGIEMCLIIAATQEPLMVKMWAEDGDPHSYAAELFFGDWFTNIDVCLNQFMPTNKNIFKAFKQECKMNPKAVQSIRKEYFKLCKKVLRGAAKNGQFALAYGASVKKISQTIQVPLKTLQPGFVRYCEEFPRIASFTKDRMDLIRKLGYVKTVFGRKLWVSLDKAHGAGNTDIQGTAAGIIKRAQTRVSRYLEHYWGNEIKIVLPIYDELVFSVPKKYEKYEKSFIKDIDFVMTDIEEIPIQLKTEWKKSYTSWTEAKEIKDE